MQTHQKDCSPGTKEADDSKGSTSYKSEGSEQLCGNRRDPTSHTQGSPFCRSCGKMNETEQPWLLLFSVQPRHAELRSGEQDQPRNIPPEQQSHRHVERPIKRLEIEVRQDGYKMHTWRKARSAPPRSMRAAPAATAPAGWAAASKSRRRTGCRPLRCKAPARDN